MTDEQSYKKLQLSKRNSTLPFILSRNVPLDFILEHCLVLAFYRNRFRFSKFINEISADYRNLKLLSVMLTLSKKLVLTVRGVTIK